MCLSGQQEVEGSVGDGRSRNSISLREWPGEGVFFKILSIIMVHSGLLFMLFCTLNRLRR